MGQRGWTAGWVEVSSAAWNSVWSSSGSLSSSPSASAVERLTVSSLPVLLSIQKKICISLDLVIVR